MAMLATSTQTATPAIPVRSRATATVAAVAGARAPDDLMAGLLPHPGMPSFARDFQK